MKIGITKTIRTKFTAIFVAIFAALLIFMLIFCRIFMQKFYLSEKIHLIDGAYETIDQLVLLAQEHDASIFDLIVDYDSSDIDSSAVSIFRVLNERSNIDVVLMNADKTKSAATSRESNWAISKLYTYVSLNEGSRMISDAESLDDQQDDSAVNGITPFQSLDEDNIFKSGILSRGQTYEPIKSTERYTIHLISDARSGAEYIECFGIFSDNDTYVLLSCPLANIADGARIATIFMVNMGFIILVIGSIIMYFASYKLTSPIIKLSKLSDKISKLDFSERYEGDFDNEIGVLGNSMNSMSLTLEKYIEELKEANAKLQEDIEEKIRIDEARKEFIANVSHELKTPIALIEGYAEGLVEGLAEDKDSRDYYCNVIMDETVKMNKLVRDLTSLISYEFGSVEPDLTEFNICELIRSVSDSMAINIEDKGARLKLDLPDRVLVYADEFKIEEVYTNYINNALNHVSGERNISVSLEENDSSVTVYVYNDGELIPEESIPHLWEKFYKVDKARTRAYGGSGIGLSIVKAIIEAHGGRYGVNNKENGVEFYFTLNKKLDA